MNIILFETDRFRNQLKPLTLTRPIGMLRMGIHTIKEKWEKRLNATVSFKTVPYLQSKFELSSQSENLFINSSFLPTKELLTLIKGLKKTEIIIFKGITVAYFEESNGTSEVQLSENGARVLKSLPDLFLLNSAEIVDDFEYETAGRSSESILDIHTRVYGKENIFLEKGVSLRAVTLNAENGPIYIGKNAILQEGAILIGPVAIGEGSMVAFGARIRPNTTLGPLSRVGGEVGNSIFHGQSNKAHDGFLGNSYIGEWCNLGANTNNSNLKNDYKSVKLHSYETGGLEDSKELFCGTFMGDFTKAGISTMFNTGTVVGVCSNVFGAGFQEKFIPSFSWGGKAEGYANYRFEKAVEVINATMARRNQSLSELDLAILTHILEAK